MILTVTLNAALDITYRVPVLQPHSSHRVQQVYQRAGGKGINVARVLRALGHDTVVTGLAGGGIGRAIRAELALAGLTDELVQIAGESRRTVTVVSSGAATVFNEPGPVAAAAEWTAFAARFAELAAGASAVVLAGSLPPGLPADAYGELLRRASGAGAMTVLDTSGPALTAALASHPDVVKPNAAELREAAGHDGVVMASAGLLTAGAGAVVASLGPDGLRATTPERSWRACLPAPVTGNPTGAGDACVAALTAARVAGHPWPLALADAVAVSAAAVATPVAGDIDLVSYRRLRPSVAVEELDAHPHR